MTEPTPIEHAKESPTVFAARLGLLWKKPGHTLAGTLTWDRVLDMAVGAYWSRRVPHKRAS